MTYSKNLENNKKLRTSFVDYRFKRIQNNKTKKVKTKYVSYILSKISKGMDTKNL